MSPIFTVPKNDGKVRIILNLKTLYTFLEYSNFKFESIHTILQLVTPGAWMVSIDLKDAYYSVPTAKKSQKYLEFRYGWNLYQFTCYPTGLYFFPRKVTKLMKALFSTLHSSGHLSSGHLISGYIDDFFLINETYQGCIDTVNANINHFDNLGFVIHPAKSLLVPTQQLIFLEVLIDSVQMRLYLSDEKMIKIKAYIQIALNNDPHVAIELAARIFSLFASSFLNVQYGKLHYRYLEMDKIEALRVHKGN